MPPASQLGFCNLTTRYEVLSQQGDPLEQLAQVVPWEAFRPRLVKVLRRSKRTKGGRPPFDAIGMFNVFVLPALYNLSYDQTEYQIRARLSFMRFLASIWPNAFPMRRRSGCFEKPWRKRAWSKPCSSNVTPIWLLRDSNREGGQLIDASLVPVLKSTPYPGKTHPMKREVLLKHV